MCSLSIDPFSVIMTDASVEKQSGFVKYSSLLELFTTDLSNRSNHRFIGFLPSMKHLSRRTSLAVSVVSTTVTSLSVPNFSDLLYLFFPAAPRTFSFYPQAVLTFTSSLLENLFADLNMSGCKFLRFNAF